MRSSELRERFLAFFKNKGHVVVPSSSLVPENDPSVLLTTAGMQQFKQYYTGLLDPMTYVHPTLGRPLGTRRAASIQKSFRTSDIDEVGDESHNTFFEMLGNFSFGDYFKEEAIAWAWEFMTKVLGLPLARVHVSVFAGDSETPADEESIGIWEKLGVPQEKIVKANRSDNFWGPTGDEGPCGPTTEIYVDGIEVWNIVFNEYYRHPDGKFTPLEQKGVDTGMGLERLSKVVQNAPTIFETDLFVPLIELLPADTPPHVRRIIADHGRAAAFLLSDGIRPSNKGAGYILRRLMRRMIVHEYQAYGLTAESSRIRQLLEKVVTLYGSFYPELDAAVIVTEFGKENEKFRKTLRQGLRELEKLTVIDAQSAFRLYETYGLPYEVMKDAEISGSRAASLRREDFEEEFRKHQEKSRTSVAGVFKGGLADHSSQVIKLHTATHLMHAGLRAVLGIHVLQKGSHINAERTRFDFTHPQKLTDEEKQKVEEWVNDKIARNLTVKKEWMTVPEAYEKGALGVFEERYGDKVSVYTIYDDKTGEVVSMEFCGGPHVPRTGLLGKFRIAKEEAVSAGIRRVKATLEGGEEEVDGI
jgi:alanyl-tRNA synthetase